MRWTAQDLADYESRRMKQTPRSIKVRVPSRAAKPATDNVEFIQSGESPPVGFVLTCSDDPNYRQIVVPGNPVSKPRQTQSDKWNLRGCVKRYRVWADEARRIAGRLPSAPQHLDVTAYFPLTKKAKSGLPHMVRPDGDNLLKAVADA